MEVTNQSIVKTINLPLGSAKGIWVDELQRILWSYQTTEEVGIGETTLYNMFYGLEAILQDKIGQDSARVMS